MSGEPGTNFSPTHLSPKSSSFSINHAPGLTSPLLNHHPIVLTPQSTLSPMNSKKNTAPSLCSQNLWNSSSAATFNVAPLSSSVSNPHLQTLSANHKTQARPSSANHNNTSFLNHTLKSHGKQKASSQNQMSGSFSVALNDYPPPMPPHLLRKLSCKDTTSVGKVKVLLKVFQGGEVPGSCRVLSVDNRRRCVTLYDPATPTTVPPPSSITPTKIIQTGAVPPNGPIVTNALAAAAAAALPSEVLAGSKPAGCVEDEVNDIRINGDKILSSAEGTVEKSSISEDDSNLDLPVVNSTELADTKLSNGTISISSDCVSAGVNESKSVHDQKLNGIDETKMANKSMVDFRSLICDTTSSTKTQSIENQLYVSDDVISEEKNLTSQPKPDDSNLCSATIKGVSAPKMFTFDGIFTHDDSQTELCSAALTDIIAAALRGAHGAVFTFGQPHLGQRETMIGSSKSCHTLGVLPSAVCWLYNAMQEGAVQAGEPRRNWSVTVSAAQVGPGDQVVDLLLPFAVTADQSTATNKDNEKMISSSGNTLLSVGCGDDELVPSILSKLSEVSASTMTRAAQLLDLVLSARHVDEFGRPAHLLFSLNIYQQEKGTPISTSGTVGSTGCWGRLHLLDFGPVDRGCRASGGRAVTLSALGNTILAIINGQKQPPQKQVQLGVLGQLVRECVGSLRCVTSMLVHVSAEPHKYQDTLASIQLAARVHRLRRRRVKPQIGGSGSGGSSEESKSGRSSRGTITDTGSSSMDPSSSELSCDTVIYVGPGADEATDSEHPPVFLPSGSSPENRCSIRKALKGSSVDSSRPQDSPRTPRKIIPKKSPKHGSSKEAHSPLKSKERYSEDDQVGKDSGNLDPIDVMKHSQSPSNRSPCKHCSHSTRNGPSVSPKHQKCLHGSRQRKTLLTENIVPCCPGPSDEQWVDGPRFHKSKVLESQKIKECELETWIDGPEATYGYMDDVKKIMIQKWVETQNSQSHVKEAQGKSPKHRAFKEMTQFKTSEQEETSPKHRDKHRDKRRSSDGRELKKDSTKHSSQSKDSPHRRRSLNGPQHRMPGSSDPDSSLPLNESEKMPTENSSPIKNRLINPSQKECLASESTEKQEIAVLHDGITSEGTKDSAKFIEEIPIVQPNEHVKEQTSSQADKKCVVICDTISYKSLNEADRGLLPSSTTLFAPETRRGEHDTLSTEACKSSTSSHAFPEAQEDSDRSDKTSEVSQEAMEEETASQLSMDEVEDEEALPEARVYLKQFPGDPTSWEDCEFIEVEEPMEPVELVDSWTQVTEEDLQTSGSCYSVRNLQPLRRFLPPVQEEVEPSADSVEEDNVGTAKCELKANEVTNDPSVADAPGADQHPQLHLDDDICQVETPGSTRFEEMIQDPSFMAKTHYFAQRLEELRKLHQFYKNLAKQAPRRNSSMCQSTLNGAMLPDLLIRPIEDELMDDDKHEFGACLPPLCSHNTMPSRLTEPDYNLDWKSLLPEEIELISEAGDSRTDADDSASDFSKDFNETVYDIQSDIMPYLPSNYVSLSSLTAHRPPDLIMTGNLNYTVTSHDSGGQIEGRLPSPIVEDKTGENNLPLNPTSLSDDEVNVNHLKVKKEKKKKKLGLISSSKRTTKEISETDASLSFSKISWSRIFSGARRNSSPKESPKKTSKCLNKNYSRDFCTASPKSNDKLNRKYRDKECTKEQEKIEKKSKDGEFGKDEQRSPRDLKLVKDYEGSRNSKSLIKTESDKIRSKNSRKSNDYRTSSSSNSAGGRSSKREFPKENARGGTPRQDQSGRGKCSVLQRENLPFQTASLSGSNSSTYHGYDSGADSGVGLRVTTSRSGRRSQMGFQGTSDCRQGESSGYESVIRDSECSSFGSSQDSGLDDDGNASVPVREKDITPPNSSAKQCKNSCLDTPPPNSTYEAGLDVCESLDFTSNGLDTEAELQQYTEDEVKRYETRRRLENQASLRTQTSKRSVNPLSPSVGAALCSPEERIQQLREEQTRLKIELEAAKTRLMIDKSRWSYELHVESAMMPHEDGFLEALETETSILKKRVAAASSRCLLESSFLNRKVKLRHKRASQKDVIDGAHSRTLGLPSFRGCGMFPGSISTLIDDKFLPTSHNAFAVEQAEIRDGAGDSVRLSGVHL